MATTGEIEEGTYQKKRQMNENAPKSEIQKNTVEKKRKRTKLAEGSYGESKKVNNYRFKKSEYKEHPLTKEIKKRAEKYSRGPGIELGVETDLKLFSPLRRREEIFSEAALNAAKTEQWLLPSEDGYLEAEGAEVTRSISQKSIVNELNISSAANAFDLRLPELGPYCLDYSRNSKHFLIGGKLGHLAMVEWKKNRIVTEFQVKEKIYDVKFLHTDVFFAAAQTKYAYIYDKRGVEIHCLKNLYSPTKLEFLPQHYLLASVGKGGVLTYTDTSTGAMPAQHRTKFGRCDVMTANPHNAVISLGHNNGTVTFWSPNMSKPLVSIQSHQGPVSTLGIDQTGTYLVTTGIDRRMKVYDVRKFQPLVEYFNFRPARSVCVSQKGLVAVGFGSAIQVWKDAFTQKQQFPYMRQRMFDAAEVECLKFCPYEDVLGVGHSKGFTSLIIPGSAEPNFDSYVANPFETAKQRKEGEVHRLLDKLQPETIVLNPNVIGSVKKSSYDADKGKYEAMEERNKAWNKKKVKVLSDGTVVERKKMKGKGKTGNVIRTKNMNAEREKRPVLRAKLLEEKKKKDMIAKETEKEKNMNANKNENTNLNMKKGISKPNASEAQYVPSALDRFKKKVSK